VPAQALFIDFHSEAEMRSCIPLAAPFPAAFSFLFSNPRCAASSRAIGAVTGTLFKAPRTRTGQWVRNSSFHEGAREERRWKEENTFSPSEHNARMRAAEEFDRETRAPGKRNGSLGHIGLEVLRFMLRLRNRKTGRLDPSYSWIAEQLGRSRSAVAAALARLKEHGFLDWIRRTRVIEEPRDDGQYVEQISNAYFFSLPGKIAEQVRRMIRRPSEVVRRTSVEQERSQRRERATKAADGAASIIAGVQNPTLRAILERTRRSLESASPPSSRNEAL
jgi:DNA-binding Lrp family transcriptional regulator